MPEKYNVKAVEPDMLDYWEKNQIHKRAKEKSKGKEQFYFLDGPPYTSGKVHLGIAWNKALKDCFLRYKRMAGFDVWDRAGYDMHGIPTERATEEELGIKNKDEIPKYGVAKFTGACRNLALRNLELMNKDFTRLGVWMDFENAYQTISDEWINGEWWLIKKAHENKRLYEGEKTMHWCAKCGTALAKHELEYKNVDEESIFVRLKVKNKKNEYLIIWTTTPWTIPFNLGVMAHPEIEYIRAKVDDEIWILAKGLAGGVIRHVADKKFDVIEEFTGKELEGLEYIHPFEDIIKDYKEIKKRHPKTHTVVLSEEYVNLGSGSGLVHMAPGCGPEDYEVGHKNNIPPYNNLKEDGTFPENMGKFSGLKAKKDDKKFVDELKNKKALIETAKVEHEYPYCWRCKEPVIFRTTKQWFFKIEDLKENMRKLNKKIKWVPDFAGSKSFDSWLANLRDNGITRQRYWGTPLPIWKCRKCNSYDVVGSIDELKKLAGKLPEDLHKPWIDEIKIPCECGGEKERYPDILDVWIDAGSASWNCLDYPAEKENFKKLFPADFILEGIDQIRGWFNMLFVASMISMQKPSYKAVYMHGFINDALGRKMSKSLKNYIVPEEVIDVYGADALRYYMIGGALPGIDINYNFDDMKLKNRNLHILWNIHCFLIDLANTLDINPSKMGKKTEAAFSTEEFYIFSKLNSLIEKTTMLYDEYRLNEIPWAIEEIFLELSRTYLQLTREKVSSGSEDEKKVVLYTVYNVLLETLKMFSAISPFISEKIYLNLKNEFGLKEQSVSLYEWPKADKKLIDKKLEENFNAARDIIQAILSAREKIQLGIRWPLKEAIIVTLDKNLKKAAEEMIELIKTQANIKEIKIKTKFEGIKQKIKSDYAKMGPAFGDDAPKIIANLAVESAETILSHLEKDGKYSVTVNGKKIDVLKEHLMFEREVPSQYAEAELKNCLVYIDRELTDELEAEGYSREIMRRVQALRKKAGLQKKDNIVLYIKTDDEMKEMLSKHEKQIKERVGASLIKISELNPSKKHHFESDEKVKEEKFRIFFDKI